jgi:Na+-transporting methylmalonyl-CoA/oxaloacetate decarboxylase gamma subunit
MQTERTQVDGSLTGGLPMTVIGIGTVFAALLSLIFVIMAMTRLTTRPPPPAQAEASPDPAQTALPAQATAGDDGPDLVRVALAAYALHLQIRGRESGPGAPDGNRWALAGRMQQMTGLSR